MKTRNGQIITVYNADNTNTSWDYHRIVVDPISSEILVEITQMPLDYEKNIQGIYVLVEVDNDNNPILDENGCVNLIKKTMNVRDVLAFYCPSKEIKQRINNKQIKINNIPINSLEVECNFDYDNVKVMELPEFLIQCGLDLNQLTSLKHYGDFNIMDFFGSPTLENGPTNIENFIFLRDFVLLSLSKKEHYVYWNNDVDLGIPYSIKAIL